MKYTREQVERLTGRSLDRYGYELERALASTEETESIVGRFALIATPEYHHDYIVPRWGWAVYIEPTIRYLYY